MSAIHVCSLARLGETVARSGASHLVTLINVGTPVERPLSIPADRHLFLGVSDIVSPIDGMILPAATHIEQLLSFVDIWDRTDPLVVHCFAGISRSSAAAFIALCHLNPSREEREIALDLRRASPSASPNPRLVALADRHLGRGGRMIEAIERIGVGSGAFEADPFHVPAPRSQ